MKSRRSGFFGSTPPTTRLFACPWRASSPAACSKLRRPGAFCSGVRSTAMIGLQGESRGRGGSPAAEEPADQRVEPQPPGGRVGGEGQEREGFDDVLVD